MIAQTRQRREVLPAVVLALLVAAHVYLAYQYLSATPYRTAGVLLGQRDPATGRPALVPDVGAPDERQHANYIAHILQGKGLPVLVWEVPDPNRPGAMVRNPDLFETYQSHQPPLYYLVAAGIAKVSGLDPTSPSAKALRLINVAIGGATVLAVYFLALWSFRWVGLALVASAIAALIPMNLALSGAISNDPLLFLLCTVSLALYVKGASTGWSYRLALAAGLCTGLALLTKTTAIALLPVMAVAFAITWRQRLYRGPIVLAAGVALLLAAPWWARNQALYGDPLALRAFNEAFVGSPPASAFISQFGLGTYLVDWVGWWTGRSFIGVFGYMDIFLNETGTPSTDSQAPNTLYRWTLAVLAVAAVACLVALRDRRWREVRPALWLNALFLAVIVLLFLRFNMQYFQGQARYLYPAVGPICGFLALGLAWLCGKRARMAFGVAAIALLALNANALGRLGPEFERRASPVSSLISGPMLASNLRPGPGLTRRSWPAPSGGFKASSCRGWVSRLTRLPAGSGIRPILRW